jgi:hypothetical protein
VLFDSLATKTICMSVYGRVNTTELNPKIYFPRLRAGRHVGAAVDGDVPTTGQRQVCLAESLAADGGIGRGVGFDGLVVSGRRARRRAGFGDAARTHQYSLGLAG